MKNNYEKSNEIERVSLNVFNKKNYQKLLESGKELKEREMLAQVLIDYLCEKFKIKGASVKVLQMKQPHLTNYNGKLKMKKEGAYRPAGRQIIIYNLTAMKGQVVSIKEFVNTLIHEFMHHYDLEKLGLEKSIHSGGFYKRIGDLTKKLS